jgi:hypothetical protein
MSLKGRRPARMEEPVSLRTTANNFLKLTAAGMVVFASALVFLLISADGDVSQVRADLYDLQPIHLKQHQDFGRVMEDSGLRPRRYDYNGNEIKFAVADSDLEPRALLEVYQKRLKDAGINTDIYLEPYYVDGGAGPGTMRSGEVTTEDRLRKADALVDGEVVPIVVNDNHIAMVSLPSGADLEGARRQFGEAWKGQRHGDAADTLRLLSRLTSTENLGDLRFEEQIDAFRYLEAFRDAQTGQTTVTATWSDGGFDATKISDPKAVDNRLDLDVPPCIGCVRNHRIEGLEEDEPYVVNHFQAPLEPQGVRSFYDSSLADRGWRQAPSTTTFAEFAAKVPELREFQRRHGQTVTFERDGQTLTLFLSPDPGKRQTNILSLMDAGTGPQ